MNYLIYRVMFLFAFSVFVVTPFICEAEDNDDVNDRIGITADQIMLTENGMFLLQSGDVLPLSAIFSDSQGLYIKASLESGKMYRNTCLNGHDIYHRECGGCAHWFCPFRCKCYSPWCREP